MRLQNVLLVLLVLGIFLISSCAQYGQQNKPATQTTPAPTPAPADTTPITSPQQQKTKTETTPTQPTPTAIKEFKITARQFQFEPSTVEVNKGDKVKLIITSVDVPHGFSVPEYGINERLDPGKPVTIEFTADKQGTFTAFCSVFCGSGHSGMKGKIVVR